MSSFSPKAPADVPIGVKAYLEELLRELNRLRERVKKLEDSQ
jgi:hypothetical protein